MTQLVEVPGMGQVEFPDGMSDADIVKAIKKNSMAPRQNNGVMDTVKKNVRDFAMAGVKGMVSGGPLMGILGESSDKFNRTVEKGAYKAGGAVTDIAAKVLPPEVAAGAGLAANVGVQALPMIAAGQAAKQFAPQLQAGGRAMMQSALKPTIKDLGTGKAARAIDTLLEEGVNPTRGGMNRLRQLSEQLGKKIKDTIAMSPATVSKGEVGKSLTETYNQFKKQVNPNADLAAIKKAWMEFRNHPMLIGKQDIPVQLAQELKQGTYTQLAKKYGQLGSADEEAQKAIARGLKEQISKAVPEVAAFNAKQSELINALKVSERRALMEANKNPMGLALLAQNPATWAAFMADKSALFKSLIARMMYSGSEQIPATAARLGVGSAMMESGQPPKE